MTNYQWSRNGVAITDATNATLNFTSLAFTNYGTYGVTIGDGAYLTVSANVTVLPPAPSVVTSPTSRAAVVGSAASFTGSGATSSGVTNYQWMRNAPLVAVSGANYTGVTNTTLNIATVQSTNFGPYALRISDGFNFVTSSIANLTLAVSPTVTNQLSGTTLNLSFGSEVGPQYITEWKGALTNGVWNPMTTNNGTGSPITVPASTTPDTQRFFRVRLR